MCRGFVWLLWRSDTSSAESGPLIRPLRCQTTSLTSRNSGALGGEFIKGQMSANISGEARWRDSWSGPLRTLWCAVVCVWEGNGGVCVIMAQLWTATLPRSFNFRSCEIEAPRSEFNVRLSCKSKRWDKRLKTISSVTMRRKLPPPSHMWHPQWGCSYHLGWLATLHESLQMRFIYLVDTFFFCWGGGGGVFPFLLSASHHYIQSKSSSINPTAHQHSKHIHHTRVSSKTAFTCDSFLLHFCYCHMLLNCTASNRDSCWFHPHISIHFN